MKKIATTILFGSALLALSSCQLDLTRSASVTTMDPTTTSVDPATGTADPTTGTIDPTTIDPTTGTIVPTTGSTDPTTGSTTTSTGTSSSTTGTSAEVIHVTSVSLNKKSLTLDEGNTDTLSVTVLPTNASNKNVTWVSSNPGIASVNNGKVTAISNGDTVITVTTEDGAKVDTCNVHVNGEPTPISATGITLTPKTVTLELGELVTLSATVLPAGADQSVTWKSSNESIATVLNGVVTAKSNGTASITVKSVDGGFEDSCSITVNAPEYKHAGTLDDPFDAEDAYNFAIKQGETASSESYYVKGVVDSFTESFNPSYGNFSFTITENGKTFEGHRMKNGPSKTSFTSESDLEIGNTVVMYGPIVNYKSTTPEISGTAAGGGYIVSINKGPVAVTGLEISETSATVKVGKTYTLTANILPSNADDTTVTWTSSNPAIASVSNGVVTGVAKGNAVITVTSNGNPSISKTCSVSVVDKISVTGVTLNKTSLSLSVGGTEQLTANVMPINAENKSVTWSSSNGSKVSVSSSGSLTAVSEGTSTITVTTADGGHTATCQVTVTAKPVISKKSLDYDYSDYVKNNCYTMSSCPNTGNPKLLIIPVWFTDSSNYISTSKKATVREDIQNAYLGTNSSTGWRSVKTYYEELSNNKMSLTGLVTDWYEPGYAATSLTDDKVDELVSSAANNYFSTHSSDSRKNYDTNGDGYLDGVILIYAAPDSSVVETMPDCCWAYCYWLETSANKNNPSTCVYFWASFDFMYGSNTASSHTGKSYYNGDTSYCTIDSHTFIHEMGHVMGLDDYYDYSYQYNPAGGFSMQDYNVGSHDPYSAMALGWADPYVPTETITIDLKPFQSDHDLIVLSNHNATFNSPFDEYLLLELYTPTGLNEFDSTHQYSNSPKGPTTSGIRLWHVDGRLVKWKSGEEYYTTPYTDPTVGNVYHMMSNTYYGEDGQDYISPLGPTYADYNILQLIRNGGNSYKPTDDLSSSSLFKSGTITMSSISKQFKNAGKLNTNTDLGWSFTINSCSSSGASITVTKL